MKAAILTFVMMLFAGVVNAGKGHVVSHGQWHIAFNAATGSFDVCRKSKSSLSPVFMGSIPEATYVDATGNIHTLLSSAMKMSGFKKSSVKDDAFGKGTSYSYSFTDEGDVCLQQCFTVYEKLDGIIVDLVLCSANEIKSNYLAPISCRAPYKIFDADSDNRMLKVPYDNDGFVRYHRYHLDTEMTSYEVAAIYEGRTRKGIVIGSIDHDRWKNAIAVSASQNSNITALKAFSGVSDDETRDKLPHGCLKGTTIRSARFFVGYSSDWRDGMEQFAEANLLVAPAYNTWTAGTPMGWQSWGVLSDHCNANDVTEISDYYASVLQPEGFHNSQHNVIMSLDSWSNMNDDQVRDYVIHAGGNGQMVGVYMCPFSLWWGADSKDNYVGSYGGKDYTVRDICIKVNGEPVIYDGCFCRDPTHPINRQEIQRFVDGMSSRGVKYVKCDFLNCGMIQSDSYYDESVTTAVEAYNSGMQYLADMCKGKGIFIAMSISPVFPYQYANSRRVACDTWAKIDQTEYGMNALSGGWWTGKLYQYNDPDHVVLVGNGDQGNTTIGENRARYTNAAATGMVLVADNFSARNQAQRGNPELSKERASVIMTNPDVNEMAYLGVSFRPVYGYNEYKGEEQRAENFHYYCTEKYLYVVGINYGENTISGQIPLGDLGVVQTDVSDGKELWSGADITVSDCLDYRIPAKDACIYRLTLKRR